MWRRLVHNWDLKIVSVAIALALWFFVVSGDRSQLTLAAAVEYEGVDERLVLVGSSREAVDVQLEAPRWALARLGRADLHVRVGLAALGEGERMVRLSPGQVQAPPGATVTGLTPTWLRVSLAPAAEKSLRVVPRLRGTPAPDHVVHRVDVEPATVQVKGPRATIESRTSIETLPLDVSGSRASVSQTVGLVLADSVYPVRERTVRVTVDIRPDGSSRPARKGSSR